MRTNWVHVILVAARVLEAAAKYMMIGYLDLTLGL